MDSVTKEGIEKKILKDEYMNLDGTTLTICVLTLENGYTVTGESACVDPAKFDHEIGKRIAREDAFEKIWALEGYLLKQKKFEEEQ